jgi:hypothetical protein
VGLLVSLAGIAAPGDHSLLRPRHTDGYRHMNGYSSHTFSLINAKNELFYVRWHFKTKQGIKNFFREQAGALEGTDRIDSADAKIFHYSFSLLARGINQH